MEIEIGTWWTAPTESEDGHLILVSGRKDIEKFRTNPRFSIRVEVTWKYDGDDKGMPDKETSTMMEEVQDALQKEFKKDPEACRPVANITRFLPPSPCFHSQSIRKTTLHGKNMTRWPKPK